MDVDESLQGLLEVPKEKRKKKKNPKDKDSENNDKLDSAKKTKKERMVQSLMFNSSEPREFFDGVAQSDRNLCGAK